VYATDLDTGRLTLGVSGMLWEGSLVMVDSETNSLWSHIMGEAMRGPMTGTRLEKLASALTEWGEWKTSHPDTTVMVMPRSAEQYVHGFHDRDGGLLIGMVTARGSKSWSFSELYDNSPVNDVVDDLPVVVVLDRDSFTATIVDRRADGRRLTFESREGELVDSQTGSVWNPLTGKALSGTLEGQQLRLLPGVVSDSAVWNLYYSHDNPRE